MKKILFVFIIALLFLAGCGENETDTNKNKFGLNENKVTEKAISQAEKELSLRPFFKKEYKKDDIKVNKICKATLKTNTNFTGEYIIFWETKDEGEKGQLLLDNENNIDSFTSMNGTASHEVYNNECIKIN